MSHSISTITEWKHGSPEVMDVDEDTVKIPVQVIEYIPLID